MNPRTRDFLVLIVAAGVAVASLYSTFSGHSPKIDLGPYTALGVVTAEETVKLLRQPGRVLVIARDTGPDKNPSVEAGLEAFERTLKKQAGFTLLVERFVATPMVMMATGGGVPPDELAKALEAHPDAKALVLMCPLPPLADPEMAALSGRGIKTVVVSSYRSDYGRLLEQGVIDLAVVPRPEGPVPGAQPPRTLRERFDQEYALVTAADVARGR